ncbi:MAG: hypothetical protein C0412_12515 [Flavobacterium sp.]|nr:hypothetical protein [Flavobacterium sp.]
MSKTKAAAYNLFFGYLFAIFNAVTGIFLLPLYFHYFSLEIYGSWLACNGLATIFGVLEGGVSMIVTQKLADSLANNDKERFSEILGSAIILATFYSILFFLGGLVVLLSFSYTLNIPLSYRSIIITAVLFNLAGRGLTFIFLTLGAVPQVFLETISAGSISALAYILNILSIIIALYLGNSIVSLGIGGFLFSVANLVGFTVYLLIKRIKKQLLPITYSLNTIKEIFKESKSVIIAGSSGIIGSNLEPAIAASLFSPAVTAILAINSKIFQVAQMFLDRIGTSVFASLALYLKSKNKDEILIMLNRLLSISLIMSVSIYGYSVIFSEEIISIWLGINSFGGLFLISVLGINALVNSRKLLLTNVSYAYGFITTTSKYLIYESIIRVLFYMLLPRFMGVVGIPLSSTVGSILVVFLISKFFAKHLGLSFKENVFMNSGIKTNIKLTLFCFFFFIIKNKNTTLLYIIADSFLFVFFIIIILIMTEKKLILFIKRNILQHHAK